MFGGAVPGLRALDASHDLAHDAFGGLVAKVARAAPTPGCSTARADEIAEVLWGSIHGLVMLELVGIDPLGSDPAARFARALDVLFDGFCTWLIRSPRGSAPWSTVRSTGCSTSPSTCAPPPSSRISSPRARSATARVARGHQPGRVRRRGHAAGPPRAVGARRRSSKVATKVPAPVVEGVEDRARLDPDRAAADHHHPARRARAPAARVRT